MIRYCDLHEAFDTDEHPDGCPYCQRVWDESVEADRQLDERRLRHADRRREERC